VTSRSHQAALVTGQHVSKDRHAVGFFRPSWGMATIRYKMGHLVASSNGIFKNRDWLAQAVKKPSDQAAESVRLARSFTEDVEFSTEDGTRSDPEFLLKMITVAVQAGATTINIPDTVGFTTPAEYAAIFRLVKARVPGIDDIILSAHCHNDLGMAVANSLAGIEGGARQVECTINGIGERAGNAALEEVAAALMVRRDKFPYTNNIVLSQLYPTSQMLAECIAFGCPPNKAVVGANAFAHESGIHQHGMMANPLAYEIMTPESVGAGHTKLVLGKHSGRRALADRLERLGHPLDRNQLDEVYARFTELADRKKSLYDQDLLGLLQPGKSIPVATV
jgi:2-isopropylmalate synthase